MVHQSLDTSEQRKFSGEIQGTDLSNNSCQTSQYRIADVAFFPAGDRRVLAYARETEVTRLLQRPVANLLAQCQKFQTIDEHVDTYCREQHLSGTMLEAIRSKLQHQLRQLAQEGYLISSSQIHQLFQAASEQVSISPITSLVIPTCNHVEGLQRGMISYIEHCQHFGRTLDYVVADDSKMPATRDAYRQMLRSLKERYGVSIAYAGFEEKATFVKKLSEVGNIPEEIVSWACIGDKQYNVGTYGANRNTLLLHTVGECIFTTDDDIICQVATSPGFKQGLALSSGGWPAESWFYPDRASALESVYFIEQDMFAQHEQWLGQDPRVGAASYSRDDLLSFERAAPPFLHRLATQPSTIAMTTHGLIGDGRWPSTEFLLFQAGESFKRLISSEQAYRSAHMSLEVAQAVNQLTITEKSDSVIGGCIGGLDNRELLPPFTPVGGCEDMAFSVMLTKCFPNVYAVHLPWILIHASLGPRACSEPTFDMQFHEWIPACIGLFNPGFTSTPTDCLSKLGQFLDEIGRLPAAALASFTREKVWQSWGLKVAHMERQLRRDQESLPAFWRRDVQAYCERVRERLMQPVEQFLCGGPEIIQRSLVQFAQILKWWPLMVETARRLRAEGYRLAQPI